LLQVACLRLSPPSLALLMAVTTASAAPLAGAALDALLDRITVLKQQQKALEAELSPLLEQLSEALETGELDASFSHNGCSFCWSAQGGPAAGGRHRRRH
jgi:hypothetical protein